MKQTFELRVKDFKNGRKIFAVIYATFKSSWEKPEKHSGLKSNQTHDLCPV